mmetsp:Transcript_13585/g.41061  ORF Transcript_13585/g.41061 Transcript_13585/m.41061 type:complete len:381 (+) Transcript_13585:378-1520(+)
MSAMEEPLLRDVERSSTSATGLQLLLEPTLPADFPEPHAGATFAQTAFNLQNVFMGIGLLSMPYAMRLSGWMGLVALTLASALFCTSGFLIVLGFERVSAGPKTFARLGSAALGDTGKAMVLVFASLEFFGAVCMSLIVIYKQIESFLPASGIFGLSPLQSSAVVATVALVPMLFVPSLRHLSHFSSLGVVSTIIVMTAVAASAVVDPHRKAAPLQPVPGREVLVPGMGIFQAFGIFAVSVSGHSSLPAIRSSMAHPQQFGGVLRFSFVVMTIIYGCVCGLGYYYFGEETSQLVTTDLALRAPFAGQSLLIRGLTVDRVVNIFITCNAFTKLPLMIVVLQDMVMGAMPQRLKGRGKGYLPYLLRMSVFVAGSLLSLKVRV